MLNPEPMTWKADPRELVGEMAVVLSVLNPEPMTWKDRHEPRVVWQGRLSVLNPEPMTWKDLNYLYDVVAGTAFSAQP